MLAFAMLPVGAGAEQPTRPYAPKWNQVITPITPAVREAEQRSLAAALGGLRRQRPGVVDAYVVVAALDGDPVFAREAREAGRVLSRRYDAEGRTIVLTAGQDAPVRASPESLKAALERAGALADPREDVIVLYATTHGSREEGLRYRDSGREISHIGPAALAGMLAGSGAANRLVILSACYSGMFLPHLATDRSVVIAAAAPDRPSFGCDPGNDWTYFGDALVNRALRKPQRLAAAFAEAKNLVTGWEKRGNLRTSNPQISIGRSAAAWLTPLERRAPRQATRPVGRSPAETPPRIGTNIFG